VDGTRRIVNSYLLGEEQAMKTFIRIILVLILMLGFAVLSDAGLAHAKAKYKITFGHVEPIHSSTHEAALSFKEIVEEESGGEIEVFIHPSSELGSGPDQGQMTQTGAIQVAILPGAHIGGIFPEIQALEIPFLLPQDIDKAAEVLNGPAGQKLMSYMEKVNLKGLVIYPLSFKQFTSNKPIRRPDDFKGLKWRTMAAPIIMESYKLLGASPVSINYHELYTALQLGTAEGEENPFWSIGEMKFYEVQKYITLSNHAAFISTMIVNKKWFEGLRADIQGIITKAAKATIPVAIESDKKIDHEWYERIKKDPGTTIIELTPESVHAFKEKLRPLRDVYIKMVGESGREVIKAFDAALPK
jgi:tripartite ATP-independent transporter DctP family solute receptor